jgi:hypothetical protein
MAKNYYTVPKTINEKEYIAQFNGLSAAITAVDNSYIDGTENTSLVKISRYILDNVIVEPRLKIDDFGADLINTTKTKVIGDKEYTARFNGLLEALKAVDNSYIDGTKNTSMDKLTRYLLENVIVHPDLLTVDDFEDMDEFNEVISFAREAMQGWGAMDEFNKVIAFGREVMQGSFRGSAKPSGAKAESKE